MEVPRMEIVEHGGKVHLTATYRNFVRALGVLNVKSGRVAFEVFSHRDSVALDAHYESWYWTGRGEPPTPYRDPFRFEDISFIIQGAKDRIGDTLTAPSLLARLRAKRQAES